MSDHHEWTQGDVDQERVSSAEAEELATGQKLLIAAVALNYGGARAVADAPLLAVPLLVLVLSLFIYAVSKIGRGFRWSRGAFALNLFFLLIPLVNLFALLRLNSKVTSALRREGYHVGFFGASR